jgi:hypothetical protein
MYRTSEFTLVDPELTRRPVAEATQLEPPSPIQIQLRSFEGFYSLAQVRTLIVMLGKAIAEAEKWEAPK